jgi:hypothetical protein
MLSSAGLWATREALQTSTSGGSRERELTALAVVPTGLPSRDPTKKERTPRARELAFRKVAPQRAVRPRPARPGYPRSRRSHPAVPTAES